MDWEAQKQRMLAQLEADYDDSDPVQKADRLTVENAVKATEEALAAKDQEVRDIRHEVEELRSLLENQSSSIGQFAVGAAAFAGMLDKDELVRHERESLQKMQESMREQLKKAEIDISMERAKIARDRAELDEQLHAMQREKAQQAASDPAAGGDKGKKPARGRWLSRLGLSEGEK
jgi:chromosome segregation ATPase